MADTHIQGPVSDAGVTPTQGASVASIVSQRAYTLQIAQIGTTKQLCTIEASADLPILVEMDAYVETVFNGTTNTISYGTVSGAVNTIMATGVINPQTLGWQAGKKILLRVRTIITATMAQTGTSTTGKLDVLIRATGLGKGVHITSL